jgi:hypothetical protein
VPIGELKVATVEDVEWPDGALGVPEDGAFYTMAIVPGYKITLAHDGTEYIYHTDKAHTAILAESHTLEQVARIRLEAVDEAGQPISTVAAANSCWPVFRSSPSEPAGLRSC